jgi:hypothetical protein
MGLAGISKSHTDTDWGRLKCSILGLFLMCILEDVPL